MRFLFFSLKFTVYSHIYEYDIWNNSGSTLVFFSLSLTSATSNFVFYIYIFFPAVLRVGKQIRAFKIQIFMTPKPPLRALVIIIPYIFEYNAREYKFISYISVSDRKYISQYAYRTYCFSMPVRIIGTNFVFHITFLKPPPAAWIGVLQNLA
jgi:hypothetical protein